jgi:hypothetical protein
MLSPSLSRKRQSLVSNGANSWLVFDLSMSLMSISKARLMILCHISKESKLEVRKYSLKLEART